jgi:integrase
MSVWRDKKGRYHVGVQRGGARIHRICSDAATWRDAKRKEAELLRGFDSVATGKVLIGDGIQRWLKEEVAHQKAKEKTEGNAYALADWVKGRYLSEIVSVAEEYKKSNRGLVTNSTINRRLSVLRRVANLSYKRWGWLPEPLGAKIELLPENPARERYLTRPELAKLLRGIQLRAARRAALVAAFTGLRRGELTRLRPINVQGDLIHLKVTKNGKPRIIPVVHHVAFALKRLPFGVHPDTLTHAVEKAFPVERKKGDPRKNRETCFHSLRHTFASFMIRSGVDLYTLAAILGHSDIRTTKRYAHLAVDNLRVAVNTLGRKTLDKAA